ncbi:MAG TPA: hypothetical protein VHR47_03780, partial [Bacillota bacterium]|nr:hypothetical protein [Bacillota bacterium]
EFIACVSSDNDGETKCKSVPDNEAYANARLIAAAPELLQACREMLNLAEMHKPNENLTGCKFNELEEIILARKAIAKAKGKL